MFLKNFLDDLNLTEEDIRYLTVLLVFSIIFTFILINQKLSFDIRSDALVYLKNSLFYAGLNENIKSVSTMYLSPVICFLTGMLMSLGCGRESIFFVTGFFAVMGNVSIYVLLKYRFNRLLSLFGSVLFTSFSLVIIYWADGTLDIPVLSLSAWVIIFIILAVYENPKYYLVCFPLAVIAIFTRYSAFFMIPLVLLYFLSKNDFFNVIDNFISDRLQFFQNSRKFIRSNEFLYIIAGIILAVILFILFCNVITSFGGGLSFITQIQDSMGGFTGDKYVGQYGYIEDNAFYLNDFLHFLNFEINAFGLNLSSILLIIVVIALAIHAITYVINFSSIKTFIDEKRQFKTKNFEKILYLLLIIFLALFFYGLNYNHMLANISMFVSIVIIFSLLDKIPISKKFYSMNFLMLAWFLVYFIFFSYINIKSPRYILSGIIPVIYFVVWSFESLFKTIQDGFEINETFVAKYTKNLTFRFNNSRIGKILMLILIILIVFLMVNSLFQDVDYSVSKYSNEDLDYMFGYLSIHDENYTSKNITTKNGYFARYGTLYLKKDIIQNPELNNTTTADYILTDYRIKYPDYKLLFKKDRLRIYEKKPLK